MCICGVFTIVQVFANGDTNHSLNSHPKMLRTHTLRIGFNSDKARQGPLGGYLK